MLRLFISASALLAAGALVASCDPYPMAGGPGGYPDGPVGGPGYPPGSPGYTPAPGQTVEVLGCVTPGVESRCAILRATDGSSWDLTGAQPPPVVGGQWAVRARGRAAVSAVGYCQQGMILSEATWEYAPLRCVAGRVQGY